MKTLILIIIFSIITVFAFGQKTYPDTLHNTEFIDVVRLKDSVYSIGEYSFAREKIDEISFSNGKKVCCYSGYPTKLSQNEKIILCINYKENLYSYKQFLNTTLDVYNHKGELVKNFPYYIEHEYVCKILAYHVFNNGDLLILNASDHIDNMRLYLYKNDTVIKILDQVFGENTIKTKRIDGLYYYFINEIGLMLIPAWSGKDSQLLLYDYSGKLINVYNIENSSSCVVSDFKYDKKTGNVLISYQLIEKNKGIVTYKIIYDIKNNEFREIEK